MSHRDMLGINTHAALAATAGDGSVTVRTTLDSCEGCGGCCGRTLPMTMREVREIRRYAREHGIEPSMTPAEMCCWLDPRTHLCRVYEVRPFVCRVWDSPRNCEVVGTKPGQPCGLRKEAVTAFKRYQESKERPRTRDTWRAFTRGR